MSDPSVRLTELKARVEMGLADIVHGKQEEQVDESTKLEGKVDEKTGDIKLDTADLDALSARIKQVRAEIKPLKAEEDRLRKLILAHPDASAGYSNRSITIKPTEDLNLDDPELLHALYKAKVLGEAMNMSLSKPKVRKIAERVKAVEKVLGTHKGRQITVN